MKKLQGDHASKLRLRLGDYRVFFRLDGAIIQIFAVKNRKESYR
jgi:mRNA-degrading endonuclease RelE of RelBE toxin-antitoxin system